MRRSRIAARYSFGASGWRSFPEYCCTQRLPQRQYSTTDAAVKDTSLAIWEDKPASYSLHAPGHFAGNQELAIGASGFSRILTTPLFPST